MRTIAPVGLLLPCAAWTPNGSTDPTPQPRQPLRRAGVLAQPSRGGCAGVVLGAVVRRVCVPRGRPGPADTAARDTTRAAPHASGAAADGR